jgi:predicted nuclease of predicted toxin-antitoxin system
VKARLDQHLSPRIAELLRERGFDVDAVADRSDQAGRSDRVIFEVACSEDRALITNNIKDFRPIAAQWLAQGPPACRANTASLVAHAYPRRHPPARRPYRQHLERKPERAGQQRRLGRPAAERLIPPQGRNAGGLQQLGITTALTADHGCRIGHQATGSDTSSRPNRRDLHDLVDIRFKMVE